MLIIVSNKSDNSTRLETGFNCEIPRLVAILLSNTIRCFFSISGKLARIKTKKYQDVNHISFIKSSYWKPLNRALVAHNSKHA